MRVKSRKSEMTSDEFRSIIAGLDYSQQDIGRLFGTDEKTPQNWASGSTKIPIPVAMWLRFLKANPAMKPAIEELSKQA